jgi:hypothetical protein
VCTSTAHVQVYTTVGRLQPRYCLRDTQTDMPPQAFIALLRYLAGECSVEYCRSDLLDTCEQQIRAQSKLMPSEYDHHRLLVLVLN